MKVVVTSGPTRAYIDEIRYISNYSTGKLGSLIASKLAKRGDRVTFIYGKGSLVPAKDCRIQTVMIETVQDLARELKKALRGADAVVHAMAVLDYEPEKKIKAKVKSDKPVWTVRFKKTPKVIGMIKALRPSVKLIGFKLEYKAGTKGLKRSAGGLLNKTGADYVVANDYAYIKKGGHKAIIMDRNGSVIARADGKEEIARAISGLIHNK